MSRVWPWIRCLSCLHLCLTLSSRVVNTLPLDSEWMDHEWSCSSTDRVQVVAAQCPPNTDFWYMLRLPGPVTKGKTGLTAAMRELMWTLNKRHPCSPKWRILPHWLHAKGNWWKNISVNSDTNWTYSKQINTAHAHRAFVSGQRTTWQSASRDQDVGQDNAEGNYTESGDADEIVAATLSPSFV